MRELGHQHGPVLVASVREFLNRPLTNLASADSLPP
jgi:hypothetical protein